MCVPPNFEIVKSVPQQKKRLSITALNKRNVKEILFHYLLNKKTPSLQGLQGSSEGSQYRTRTDLAAGTAVAPKTLYFLYLFCFLKYLVSTTEYTKHQP